MVARRWRRGVNGGGGRANNYTQTPGRSFSVEPTRVQTRVDQTTPIYGNNKWNIQTSNSPGPPTLDHALTPPPYLRARRPFS